MAQYFGKFRGVVVNLDDPLQCGRLQVQVPDVTGRQASTWAMPCAPAGLSKVRGSALPKVGATVWVEFEAGDPSRPIWVGSYWSSPADTPPAFKPKR